MRDIKDACWLSWEFKLSKWIQYLCARTYITQQPRVKRLHLSMFLLMVPTRASRQLNTKAHLTPRQLLLSQPSYCHYAAPSCQTRFFHLSLEAAEIYS